MENNIFSPNETLIERNFIAFKVDFIQDKSVEFFHLNDNIIKFNRIFPFHSWCIALDTVNNKITLHNRLYFTPTQHIVGYIITPYGYEEGVNHLININLNYHNINYVFEVLRLPYYMQENFSINSF